MTAHDSADYPERDRPALLTGGLAVTSEMVEAGVYALRIGDYRTSYMEDWAARELVLEVYRAMALAGTWDGKKRG